MSFLHDEYEGKPMTTETPAADRLILYRKGFGPGDGDQAVMTYDELIDEITRLRAENDELQRVARRDALELMYTRQKVDRQKGELNLQQARNAELQRKLDEAVGGNSLETDVLIGRFIARYDDAVDGVVMDADTAQALAREYKRLDMAIEDQAPTLLNAFRTTVAGPNSYRMEFLFRSMEEMHKADEEWRALTSIRGEA